MTQVPTVRSTAGYDDFHQITSRRNFRTARRRGRERAYPAKAGDAKSQGYGPKWGATPVGLPNDTLREQFVRIRKSNLFILVSALLGTLVGCDTPTAAREKIAIASLELNGSGSIGTVTLSSAADSTLCIASSTVAPGIEAVPLYLRKCDGSNGQQFLWASDGSLRTWSKACIDIQSGLTSRVISHACSGITDAAWSWSDDGMIRNSASKCMSINDRAATSGSPVTVIACRSASTQRWISHQVTPALPPSAPDPTPSAPATLRTLVVASNLRSVAVNEVVQFNAAAIWSDGTTAIPSLKWTANGGNINSSGLFVAPVSAGVYQITATQQGGAAYATAAVEVVAAASPRFSISPRNVVLQPGQTTQFRTIESWDDDEIHAYAMSYRAVGGTISQSGLFSSSVVGNFLVIATCTCGLIDTARVAVQVIAPTLTQVVLTPATATIAVAGQQQFTVAGVWSDASTSAPSVIYSATGGTISATGLYSAGSIPGVYRVIATHQGGTKADTSAVTVTPPAPTLTQISMTPANVSLVAGATQQFSVSAVWSDASTSTPPVNYSATGGTITSSGAFTAGNVAGTYRLIVSTLTGSKADTSVIVVLPDPLPPNTFAQDLVIHEDLTGNDIPTDFIGLSYEKTDISRSGMFNTSNARFIQLLRNLGAGVLRFGGGSMDLASTGWQNQARTTSTPSDYLTPTDYATLGNFARAANWKLIVGLNLGHYDPAIAASEAQAIVQSASSSLLSLEVGNEVDEFPSQGLRSVGYLYSAYKTEFENYVTAVRALSPTVGFSGPATADARTINSWVAPMVRDHPNSVLFSSYHLYPLGPITKESPTSARYATISNLLSPGMMQTVAAEIQQLKAASDASGKPFRITETNSAYGGGQPGVSDVFASALWGADYLFTAVIGGARGANLHIGYSTSYSAIETGTYAARPLYYGMLFFTQAAKGKTVTSVNLSDKSQNVSAYATVPGAGQANVIVINKDAVRAARITIQTTKTYSSAISLRMAASSLSATAGITVGGASVISNGTIAQTFLNDVKLIGSSATVDVPAGSAVLVSLSGAR